MKKRIIIGLIILIIILWIWYLLWNKQIKNNYEEESMTWDVQEEIIDEELIEPEELTWETLEEILSEKTDEIEESEETREVEEPIFPENYPLYGVIEEDYWDETSEDENDSDLQETEKLLMQALSEWNNEETNSDL